MSEVAVACARALNLVGNAESPGDLLTLFGGLSGLLERPGPIEETDLLRTIATFASPAIAATTEAFLRFPVADPIVGGSPEIASFGPGELTTYYQKARGWLSPKDPCSAESMAAELEDLTGTNITSTETFKLLKESKLYLMFDTCPPDAHDVSYALRTVKDAHEWLAFNNETPLDEREQEAFDTAHESLRHAVGAELRKNDAIIRDREMNVLVTTSVYTMVGALAAIGLVFFARRSRAQKKNTEMRVKNTAAPRKKTKPRTFGAFGPNEIEQARTGILRMQLERTGISEQMHTVRTLLHELKQCERADAYLDRFLAYFLGKETTDPKMYLLAATDKLREIVSTLPDKLRPLVDVSYNELETLVAGYTNSSSALYAEMAKTCTDKAAIDAAQQAVATLASEAQAAAGGPSPWIVNTSVIGFSFLSVAFGIYKTRAFKQAAIHTASDNAVMHIHTVWSTFVSDNLPEFRNLERISPTEFRKAYTQIGGFVYLEQTGLFSAEVNRTPGASVILSDELNALQGKIRAKKAELDKEIRQRAADIAKYLDPKGTDPTTVDNIVKDIHLGVISTKVEEIVIEIYTKIKESEAKERE